MKDFQRILFFMVFEVMVSGIVFSLETNEVSQAEIVPIGISIKLGLGKEFGENKLMVTLNNHTDKPIRYVEVGQPLFGWRIKVFNAEGKLLGSSGFEQAIKGNYRDHAIPPGGAKNFPLDIRWVVFRNKEIPSTCRIEIETPVFSDPHKDLSAKLTAQLKLRDDDSKVHSP